MDKDTVEKELIDSKLIPLDKSWIIRMGAMDILTGFGDDIKRFLDGQGELSGDLKALRNVADTWDNSEVIDVGEAGTLYRIMQFASWKFHLGKKFIKHDTLNDRKMCEDPSIVYWPIDKLVTLDNNTSQWATASVLLGNEEQPSAETLKRHYKLRVTYDAVKQWTERRNRKECWSPRGDETITNQALKYIYTLHQDEFNYEPEQAEDFCFSVTFKSIKPSKETANMKMDDILNSMLYQISELQKKGKDIDANSFAQNFNKLTAEDARRIYEGTCRWSSLWGHETPRPIEMTRLLPAYVDNIILESKDHRGVQAIAMLMKTEHPYMTTTDIRSWFGTPDCVAKSWPQFWDFMRHSEKYVR
jgi:hypothetical protein